MEQAMAGHGVGVSETRQLESGYIHGRILYLELLDPNSGGHNIELPTVTVL